MTPLRSLAYTLHDGCRLLSSPDFTHDELARRLQRRMESVTDLGSLSQELEHSARKWSERRQLAKAAPNVLRSLNLDPNLEVLLVPGGYGGFARYLGEQCAKVDVVEPSYDRAATVHRRLTGLDNVEVFVGAVQDIRPEAGYDLVVLVGHPEDPEVPPGAGPIEEVVEVVTAMLRNNGVLLWMATNTLSVERLLKWPAHHVRAGASRSEMVSVLRNAGLEVRFYYAFPDILNPRVVMSESLLSRSLGLSLAWRLPRFGDRRLAPAFYLWQSFVKEGLGCHFADVIVAVASVSQATTTPQLWPSDVEACFYTSFRRLMFTTKTLVKAQDHGLRFERSRLAGTDPQAHLGPITLRVSDSEFIAGVDFVEFAATADSDSLHEALLQWARLVRDAQNDEHMNIDLIPRNLVVREGGELAVIDEELYHRDYEPRHVLARGVLDLTLMLAMRAVSRPGVGRYRDMALGFGSVVGLDGAWLGQVIMREAELRATMSGFDRGQAGWRRAVAEHKRIFKKDLNRKVPTGTALARSSFREGIKRLARAFRRRFL